MGTNLFIFRKVVSDQSNYTNKMINYKWKMGGFQENLFNNLLVVGILVALGVIIYCKVTKKTAREVWEEFNPVEQQNE